MGSSPTPATTLTTQPKLFCKIVVEPPKPLLARQLVPKSKVYHYNQDNSSLSWGEEQHLGFVVLPKLKNVGAMYDSTYPTVKTREEQQQMPPKLLFYHSTKTPLNPTRPKYKTDANNKLGTKRRTKEKFNFQ